MFASVACLIQKSLSSIGARARAKEELIQPHFVVSPCLSCPVLSSRHGSVEQCSCVLRAQHATVARSNAVEAGPRWRCRHGRRSAHVGCASLASSCCSKPIGRSRHWPLCCGMLCARPFCATGELAAWKSWKQTLGDVCLTLSSSWLLHSRSPSPFLLFFFSSFPLFSCVLFVTLPLPLTLNISPSPLSFLRSSASFTITQTAEK